MSQPSDMICCITTAWVIDCMNLVDGWLLGRMNVVAWMDEWMNLDQMMMVDEP